MPGVSLIAALDADRVIGRDNAMPWRLPEDLRRFRSLTLGHPVIMGRKTFASIGKPLPGRDNIVITRSADYRAQGCRIAHSLAEALTLAGGAGEVFVIGGAQIYAAALPLAHRLYLTEIDARFGGDTFFPDFDRGEWREVSRETHVMDGPGGFRYHFVLYER